MCTGNKQTRDVCDWLLSLQMVLSTDIADFVSHLILSQSIATDSDMAVCGARALAAEDRLECISVFD